MKIKLFMAGLLMTGLSFAQTKDTTQSESPKERVLIPKITVGLDLANILDDYVSFLPFVEFQLDEDFAIMQELGYVIQPESYDGRDFDRYFGIEGRTEIKYYHTIKPEKRARNWLGLDLAYQFDDYQDQFWINRGNFQEEVVGDISRRALGFHIRAGTERVFKNEKGLISASIGIGRQFFNLNMEPEGNIMSAGIRDYPLLDPFSVNVRLKIGFVLKSLRK